MITRTFFCLLSLCMAAMFAPASALGTSWLNSPVGEWTFSYWNDDAPAMPSTGSRVICFRPDNTWFSTTNGMAGHWFQKGNAPAGSGNRVRLLGNWGNPGVANGNITMELDFVNETLLAGSLTIWRDPTLETHPTPWMRTQAQRTAQTC